MKGLYIHIPFCNSICSYCDFPKQVAKQEKKKEYIQHLLKELDLKKEYLKDVRSVYIGGGTPNSLNDELLESLLDKIKDILVNSIENTIEINSELLTENQIKLFNKYNINRVSIGVQTIVPKLINNIKRNHNYQKVVDSINLLHKNHIHNINLDMMYGLPGQTMNDLEEDINFILSQDIKHISYYSLIKEEKTLLEYQLKHNQISIPDDDLVADMYEYVSQKLKMNDFRHYEISNYAKEGYNSIHNIGYWDCDEYIGIGSSAASLIMNRRFQNHISLPKYYQNELIEDVYLDIYEQKQEFMMLGLRKVDGINIQNYYERFKSYPKDDFDIEKLLKFDLIDIKNDIIKIKEDKILLANIVFKEFVG